MIKTFKHKGLEQFFIKDNKKLLDAKTLPKISRILDRLDVAKDIKDMDIPGWNLHELKGDRKSDWSVSVCKNWRITFNFRNQDAYNVNLEDYH